MAFSKSVNLAHAQTAVPCSICEDEPPGEYYCIECKQTLCPLCEKNHRRVAATKNHNIVLRTQVGDIDTTTLTCSDHGDHASFHCEKCNIPVCGKCITGKHRGHELSDLADIFDREKEVLQNDVKRVREILSKLKKEREDMISEKKKYDTKLMQIKKDLEAERKAALKELQKTYDDKTKDLDSIQENHSTMFKNFSKEITKKIDILEERIKEYHDTIRKNTLSVIGNPSKRENFLLEIERKPEIPKPPEFTPRNEQDLVNFFGKLQFSSDSTTRKLTGKPLLEPKSPTIVSKFKCPLQGVPRIGISKKGDVWLGGNKSRELVMVDIKGQVLSRRNIQNRTTALAVMDCGDVIISPHEDDSSSVSKLLRDGKDQHLFYISHFWSLGVSVTANQKILICTYDGEVVIINNDGSNAKQLYKGSGYYSAAHAVENADGNIYISDCKNSAVVVVSKRGKVLLTIKKTEEGQPISGPVGLVVDKMGNTLCSDQDKNVIYIINQKMQLKELAGKSLDLQDPQWLAVDNDNNLWITQLDGTVLIVKYLI